MADVVEAVDRLRTAAADQATHTRTIRVGTVSAATSSLLAPSIREFRATHPFVAMRSGYLMHRFAHRLFGADMPTISYTTDGAELGNLVVAEGLGLTVLPDYSIAGHPPERAGVLTYRPVAGDRTSVTLVARQRVGGHVPEPVRGLLSMLVSRARGRR